MKREHKEDRERGLVSAKGTRNKRGKQHNTKKRQSVTGLVEVKPT